MSPLPGPGSIGGIWIVISGVDVGVEVLVEVVVDVFEVDVGVVVVGVVVMLGVAVTVVVTGVAGTVWGAGRRGRGCATGTKRGGAVTTTVEISATGATSGGVEGAGTAEAVDTAMLLAGAASPSNWVMPKTANAAIAATAAAPNATSGRRLRGEAGEVIGWSRSDG